MLSLCATQTIATEWIKASVPGNVPGTRNRKDECHCLSKPAPNRSWKRCIEPFNLGRGFGLTLPSLAK